MTSKGSAPAAGLNTGATKDPYDEDPGKAFMEKHYPWRVKMRKTPHDFEPLPLSAEERKEHPVCKGACQCQACWYPKSNRIHTKVAKREYERARG